MKEEIQQCLKVLSSGGTLLYPTDTVWGIGCDATRAKAVDKVFEIKGRQKLKSLIILVSDENMLGRYVKEIPDIAWDLIDQVDKPLTIIYPEGINLPPDVLATDGSIAIRLVRDQFCAELIRQFKKPIVSTSANFSNEPAPLAFSKINPLLFNKVDHVVNWNRHLIQDVKPSTLIKLGLKGEIELIRQ